jgi:ATP-dependent Lon protease
VNTRANGNRSAGERALDRYASEFLRGCAADLDVRALLPRDEDGGSVELFELAALDEAVRLARLLPTDAREVRLRYLKQVSAIGNRRRLATALRQQAIEDLRARFPHCGGFLESVARHSALSTLCPTAVAKLPPSLLLGEGGVGKTALARAIAKALGLPIVEIAMGGVSSGFVLAGLDVGYSTGKPGRVFESLALGEYANPLILLDELDKAGTDNRYPVTPTLYTLLEPLTAQTFEDEAVPLKIDGSHVLWIATANYEEDIEPALLSRLDVFAIPVPDSAQAGQIARYMYTDIIAAEPWGSRFTPSLDDAVLQRITDLPPRDMRRTLIGAFGRAATAGRLYLVPADICIRPRRQSPGFV